MQNGLLVVNMLIDSHRGLAEQLASCDLPTVLQSCWWDGQSTGCPHAMLALSTINRLAEHRLPLGLGMAGSVLPAPPAMPWPHGCSGQGCLAWMRGTDAGQSTALVPLKRVPGLGPCVLVVAGREAPLDLRDVRTLLGGVGDGILSKDMVVALERQLCSEGAIPSGEEAQLLQDHRCFRLLLRSFELLGAEKAVSLSILRWVQVDLMGVRGPHSRCVSAGGDVGGTWCMLVGPGGAVLHQGQVHPSTYAGADWGVLGRRAMWGQSSTCLGAGGVPEVPGSLGSQSLWDASLPGGAGKQGCLWHCCLCAPA